MLGKREQMARYLYSELASSIDAFKRCAETNNQIWRGKWEGWIEYMERNLLPSGSGIDSDTKLDIGASHAQKLVMHTSYHHMHESGMYDGWTDHTVTVTPSFSGINLRIGGRNRDGIKDYLYDTFHSILTEDISYEYLLYFLPEDKQVRVTSKWVNPCIQEWYVNGEKFQYFDAAKAHAVELMEKAR